MAVIRLLQLTDTHLVGDPRGEMHGVRTLDTLRKVLRGAAADLEAADAVLLTPISAPIGKPPSPFKCPEATMKSSIGSENKVLVLEANPALPAAPAASGSASPPPSTCSFEAMTIF